MGRHFDSYEKQELATNLRLMYNAARDDLPDRASDIASVATMVKALVAPTDEIAALIGDPEIMRDAVAVCADVLDALVETANTLNDAAVGLKHVADHFAQTDDAAGQVYKHLGSKVTDFTPHQATVPTGVNSQHAALPGADGGDASTPGVQSAQNDLDQRNTELRGYLGGDDPNVITDVAGGKR